MNLVKYWPKRFKKYCPKRWRDKECERLLREAERLMAEGVALAAEGKALRAKAAAEDDLAERLKARPGHRPEPEESGIDLVFLCKRRFVRATATGQSITSISAKLENLLPKKLHVVIPVGTYFLSSGNHQNMVARKEQVTTLLPLSSQQVFIDASCINASRPIPGDTDVFSGVERISGDLARFLLAAGDAGPMVVQAGVWALTDGYTGYSVKTRLVARDQNGNTRPAVTDSEIVEARRILKSLGIRNNL
jgi:hypothetical protein